MNVSGMQLWIANFTAKTLDWLVTTGLSIVLVVALALMAARAYRIAIGRLEKKLADRVAERSEGEDPDEIRQRIHTHGSLLAKAGISTIWIVAAMIVLKEVGIDIGPILAGAGVVGLAVGFGSQNLVRDLVSGFFIIVENQVAVGDVAAINGTGGLVESIGLRTIILRDAAGTVHVFPNGTVTTLANMTKDWSAMVFDIGVAYSSDTDEVEEVMKEVAEGLRSDDSFKDRILEPMEIMGVDAFADSAVIIKARLKTKPVQQWSVGREYRRRLKKAFDEKGIEIPFPHRTITWDSPGAPAGLPAGTG
jgi:small conductance mechanosensitive channel